MTHGEYLLRRRAYSAVSKALRTGRLVKPSVCSHCSQAPPPRSDGRSRIHAHHEDYTKPIDVTWLCVACHTLTIVHARGELNGAYTKPSRLRHGECHGRAKVTEEQVREMRRIFGLEQMGTYQLGRMYGLNHATVRAIVRREKWRHVT